MEEQDDEYLVPKPLLDRLGELLQKDGFKWSEPIFSKDLSDGWRAWFGLSGFSFDVNPVVGIYNADLVNIAKEAFAMVGRPSRQKPDTGPPLIMQDLERLIADDEDCKKHISWHTEIDEKLVSNFTSMPELGPEVAADIVYCLRQKAYPFFAAYSSFQGIQDAFLNRVAVPSPAFPNYFPLILIQLGRRDDIPGYVQKQEAAFKNEDVAKSYKEYVDALLKVVPTGNS